MKLHSIHLANYRGIVDATVDFADGVTIVEGPNEVGKSSIQEALTHLREDKASSKKASIKDTQPIGVDAGPEVAVHLTTGDCELRYAKRWLRGHYTTLEVLRPRPEQLSGDEAHERFLAILESTLDVDLLVALDVAQGGSLDQAPMAQIGALRSALGDSGIEVAEHDAFLDRVEAEYSRHFTPSGKRTGEYRAIAEEVAAAEGAHREVLVRSEAMDELVDRHARASARLETVREQLGTAVKDRDAAEETFAALSELKTVLDAAEERAEAAVREAKLAEEARQRRTQLVDDAAAAERAAAAAAERASELESSQTQSDTRFAQAQEAHAQAQKALAAAKATAKQATRRLARARARGELSALGRRLAQIRVHEDKRSTAQATIDSIAVGAADVERLSALETDVRIAEGAKTAAAAQILVRRLGAHPVLVDGVELDEVTSGERAVVSDVRIAVEGIADITARPGVSPVELDDALAVARRALADELERLQIDSVAEAREQANRRADAEAEAAEAGSALKALLGRDQRSDLESAFARAEALVEDDDEVSDGGAGADSTDSDSIAALEAELAAAEEAVDTAQRAVEEASAHLDRARSAHNDARVATVRAQTSRQEAGDQAERLARLLAEARAAEADAALDDAVSAARERSTQAADHMAEARASYAAADPESAEMTVKNARQLVLSKQAQEVSDRQEVDRLTALIDDRAAEGIYEKLSAATEALESAKARQARLERRAQAIDLLRTTVHAHRDEAQRKYVAPFKERIERLGRLIFGPELAVEVSENLEIASRTLGGTTVPFESLSGGTREQLALIGRLAVASLVDPHAGAPVILDDAFGFADPERLAALNVVLGSVGESAQVILLTCQPERFASVGGATRVSLR